MRFLLTFIMLAGLAGVAHSADVAFVRIWPKWRDAQSFERISEYFTGKENPGSQVILRSQPASRAGFYFLARVKNSGPAHATAKIVVSVIKPDSPQAKAYTYPTALPTGDTVFELGLTGSDWAGEKINPVAWKIEVLGSDGQLLAVQKSFLWEMPAK
jgi:hypothetical protein